jgi:DNA-binding CsgD family transcriptional regulator
MPTNSKLSRLIEEQHIESVRSFEYAQTYPHMPNRLRGVVDWLDKNLRVAGFGFILERVDSRVAEIQEKWAGKYGLTPAEVRLMAHLVNGGTIASYAKDRGLSRNTARNQLQSAYCKTGTHRQAELVSLLLQA